MLTQVQHDRNIEMMNQKFYSPLLWSGVGGEVKKFSMTGIHYSPLTTHQTIGSFANSHINILLLTTNFLTGWVDKNSFACFGNPGFAIFKTSCKNRIIDCRNYQSTFGIDKSPFLVDLHRSKP